MRALDTAQRDSWAARLLPDVTQIADRVWAVPIPYTEQGVAYTLCYLIEAAAGAIHVLDPGSDNTSNWSMLRAGIEASGHTLSQVASIIVSHMHDDHLPLAVRLQRRTHAPIVAHEVERDGIVTNARARADALPLAEWGVPESRRAELAAPDRLRVDASVELVGVADGEELDIPGRRIVAVWTPGHTPGHLCLLDPDRDLLFSGDHVLPETRSGFGLGGTSPNNPLDDYLDSLEKVRSLGEPTVLPAHEYAFRGLDDRCSALREHHERRAQEIRSIVRQAPGDSVWQVTAAIRWKRGWESMRGTRLRLALMQTAVHLDRIED